MPSILIKYWFHFEELPGPTPLNLGCGVTADSMSDAMNLIKEKIFPGEILPFVIQVIENVNISDLSMRVQPNVGLVDARGIWFPLGYSDYTETWLAHG